jgi:hypothetical protein
MRVAWGLGSSLSSSSGGAKFLEDPPRDVGGRNALIGSATRCRTGAKGLHAPEGFVTRWLSTERVKLPIAGKQIRQPFPRLHLAVPVVAKAGVEIGFARSEGRSGWLW